MSVLRARYLIPLAQWNIPPAAVGDLTVADFAQLTDALDEQVRRDRQQAAREGR